MGDEPSEDEGEGSYQWVINSVRVRVNVVISGRGAELGSRRW